MKSRVHQIVRNDQGLFSTLDASQQLTIQLSLLDVMETAREGLLALAIQTGLRAIQVMMREEVETFPPHLHQKKSSAWMSANTDLEREGWSPPAAPYCWLQLGSGARREQMISTDQGNGLIYDPPWGTDFHSHPWQRGYPTSIKLRATRRAIWVDYPLSAGGSEAPIKRLSVRIRIHRRIWIPVSVSP